MKGKYLLLDFYDDMYRECDNEAEVFSAIAEDHDRYTADGEAEVYHIKDAQKLGINYYLTPMGKKQ